MVSHHTDIEKAISRSASKRLGDMGKLAPDYPADTSGMSEIERVELLQRTMETIETTLEQEAAEYSLVLTAGEVGTVYGYITAWHESQDSIMQEHYAEKVQEVLRQEPTFSNYFRAVSFYSEIGNRNKAAELSYEMSNAYPIRSKVVELGYQLLGWVGINRKIQKNQDSKK